MFASPSHLLHWSRILCQRFFYRFGLHCATHQIRIILVSSVVITSLFYPALAIYSSSLPKSMSILDTFGSRNTNIFFEAQKDLVNLWSSHDTIKLHEDSVSRAKCGVGTALRVERVLIHADDDGAVTHQTLISTLDFESRLERLVSSRGTPCLKGPNGRCFVLSPLLFWNYDKEKLASDTNIMDTFNSSPNVSVGYIPITPQMVLAGRGSDEPHVAGFDFARFLALTYFFPGSDCLGDSEHTAFLQSVHQVLEQNIKPAVQVQEPTLIALEYDPGLSKGERWSALSAFLYLPYLGFIVYVAWSVRKMNAVHSRLGVTFTALVEIAVSTVTSLSVCALVGFKVTLVPWELLPIVIVFVGAENMFTLVDAVGKTSVTLSVKQRIAEGLSRAGTSNTLKVVSYNAILGVIAVFSVGAVRQFCIFAIVVLVAHWFLAHTFFMAVLSIDVQRLELSELLRHDTSIAPAIRPPSRDSSSKQPQSSWQTLVVTVQNLLNGRAATNVSLLMLLAITATLYYTTYSSSPFSYDQITNVSQLGAVSRLRTSATHVGLDKKSTAWNMWKTINPAQTPLLHLRIEEPILVTFDPDVDQSIPVKPHKQSPQRFPTETFRLVLWLLQIMVLPIAATTSLLWGLLLYLLKNAELLEARNIRKSDAVDSREEQQTLENRISFSTLPRALSTDVELIAASKDGKVVVSVGLHNEIVIWRVETQCHVSIDATDVLLRTASTSSAVSTLTCVAADDHGGYFAVGTGAGAIAVWVLEEDKVLPLPVLSLDMLSARVVELRFCSTMGVGHSLFAIYENGVAAKWHVEGVPTATYIYPSRRASVVRCSLVCVDLVERHLIAFCLDDGTLELIDAQAAEAPALHPFIQPGYHVQAGHPSDLPSKVHACQAELGGSTQFIIAVATDSGRISLWDGLTSECISILDEVYGRINSLRISPVQCETCHFCGHLPLESLSVAFSVDHVIRFFKLYLNDQTRRCACSRNTLHRVSSRDNVGRRSRSNSVSSQLCPSSARTRPARTSEVSPFPVSGHGVHSRRASEKETGRRSLEALTIPILGEEDESNNPSPTLDLPGSKTPYPPSSFWRDTVVVRVTDVTCERGGWGVNGTKAVGVRRKPRTQAPHQSTTPVQTKPTYCQGLTVATLERWELWTFDPAASRLQSSLLADLTKNVTKSDRSPVHPSRTRCPADSIPRLPFTRVSPFLIASKRGLAGFGNTVGIFSFVN